MNNPNESLTIFALYSLSGIGVNGVVRMDDGKEAIVVRRWAEDRSSGVTQIVIQGVPGSVDFTWDRCNPLVCYLGQGKVGTCISVDADPCSQPPTPRLVVKSGSLRPDELEALDRLCMAWNAFLSLPIIHPDDIPEFRAHIHACQNIIGARPFFDQLNPGAKPT